MIIEIKNLIRSTMHFLRFGRPPFSSDTRTQAEFDFACSETLRSEAMPAADRIRLNLSEKDPARLLGVLESAFAQAPRHLTIELIGPGILLHDNALMLFEEIRNRPSQTRLHIRARTCLLDGAILLWLAGDTRSMRADGWIQLSRIPDSSALRGGEEPGGSIVIDDEEPSLTDLRSIFHHIDEWLPVREISGLRLFEPELREYGLLDDAQIHKQLAAYFQADSLETPAPTKAASNPGPEAPPMPQGRK